MTHFGVFANLVATVTSLVAAAGAISLAFTRRAKWQPPQEAVPAGTSRLSGLITAVGIAILYVLGRQMAATTLAVLTAALTGVALLALLTAIWMNINHSYYFPPSREEKNRKLGGHKLTPEAEEIQSQKARSMQQLFEDAQGDKDLVWTRESQAFVHLGSTLSFIVLIAAGGCALSCAGTLIATFLGT